MVISHAQALLTSSPEGMTDYIQADLRDWATISAGAQRTLDFSRPVAVLLIAVLHFILDTEDPHRLIARMMADLAPGSYLVIGHAASDIEAGTAAAMAQSYNASSALTITPRDRATVARFFDGMEMTGPGLRPLAQWWGSSPATSAGPGLSCYCGIASSRAASDVSLPPAGRGRAGSPPSARSSSRPAGAQSRARSSRGRCG